jgi:peptidoglycan/LPS O-acetylase OafA/YrhL
MAFSSLDNRARSHRIPAVLTGHLPASAVPASPAPPSHATSSRASATHLPALTSLRGLAALWVVLYHYSVQCFPNLDATPHTHLIHKGYLAVDMFFMLSGFVMTHVYHRAFSESVTRHYRSFIVARIARIYPLHVLILLLFVATALGSHVAAGASHVRDIPLHGPHSVTAFVANLFMLQGLDAQQLSWNYPAWSISVEFMAYLLFPFALPAIWHAPARAKIAIALGLLTALVVLAIWTQDDFDQWDGPITLLRGLPEFILGTLLYCAFHAAPNRAWLNRDATIFAVLAAIVLCLHAGAPDLLTIGLFAALILLAVLNTGVFSAIASAAPLIWLGDISYSLYLLHGFFQFVANKLLPRFGIEDHASLSIGQSFALMALMIGACILAAHFTYFAVEIDCRRYLRGLLDIQKRRKPAKVNLQAAQPQVIKTSR